MRSKIILIIFIVVCFALGIYNLITNTQFFEASFSNILTILIALVVSFYFVQKKTDYRRKNEKIDKLLYKIQGTILDKDFLKIKENDLIIQRSIANKIEYLAKNCNGDISNDIMKMKEKFESFRTFYGNHYMDADYMKKSQQELNNYITLIDDICDEIHIKLS